MLNFRGGSYLPGIIQVPREFDEQLNHSHQFIVIRRVLRYVGKKWDDFSSNEGN